MLRGTLSKVHIFPSPAASTASTPERMTTGSWDATGTSIGAASGAASAADSVDLLDEQLAAANSVASRVSVIQPRADRLIQNLQNGYR
jgi:hypothetical protein